MDREEFEKVLTLASSAAPIKYMTADGVAVCDLVAVIARVLQSISESLEALAAASRYDEALRRANLD